MSVIVPTRNDNSGDCWPLEDYTFFKKCGEIITNDKQCFGFICVFCNEISLQLNAFMQHINERHGKDINEINCDHQVTTTATTNTMTTLTTLLSGVDYDMEMGEEAPELLNELVYIMEDDSTSGDIALNMDEEETVELPFPLGVQTATTSMTTTAAAAITMPATVIALKKGCDITKSSSPEKQTSIKNDEQNNSTIEVQAKLPLAAESKSNLKSLDEVEEEEEPLSPMIPKTRRNGHNREVIIYLLEAYKNNAKLWDPNHPQYKYNAQRSVFNELSTPLANDLNVTLSGAEIFGILNGLRSRYRRELTKMKLRKDKRKSNLWYFEKMDFLRDVIENKRAERETKSRNKKSSDKTASAGELAEDVITTTSKPNKIIQSKETLIFLLEAYKRREALWSPTDELFGNCDAMELYEEISSELLAEKQLKLTATVCKLEIEKLIKRYRKELDALNRRKGLHIPKLWCFEQMEFLQKLFEVEVQKRKRRKKGTIAVRPQSKLQKADTLVFEKFEDQLKFIEIYKAYPALWSCEHPDYRSVKYREAALNDMLAQFNAAFNIKASIEELEKTIFTLRKAFSAEKQKLFDSTGNNDTSNCNATLNSMSTELYAKLAIFLAENLGPFRCDICRMIIKTSDQYRMHKSAHDGSLPFVCVLCGKGFQIPGNLAIHIRRHKRDFPYSCEKCNKSFATSTENTIHQRSHTGLRPYICDLCGKTFKTWSFFDIHRRVHLNQSTFLCPICDKGFYEKNRYTAHMNGHLNIRKHSCKVCGKSFTTFANLKKHSELHLPVRKYKCDTCGARFAQFASLRWHKRKTHAPGADVDSESMEQ